MNSAKIEALSQGLGRTYEELVAVGLVSSAQPLTRLFEGDDELIQKPTTGISLCFWEETRRLEKIIITLIPAFDGHAVYAGGLPAPYSLEMNKSGIRSLFGVPIQAKGLIKIPGSAGQISGGWDAYKLSEQTHPNTRVGFTYTEDMRVKTLAFALIDTGHA
ncbi:MAG: DUF6392 family protein [Pseudomonas sp.]|uniref:DUF6392 family protein n=1 Tax=Pseudomonas sp. TaxID=306 RepID=UPI0039199788